MLRKSKVQIGDKVKVVLGGAIKELEIVDVPEADVSQGKISFLAPLAQAILGSTYPKRIVVQLPNGKTMECRLLRPVTQ